MSFLFGKKPEPELEDQYKAKTKEEKKLAKEYAKRLDRVFKEMQSTFKPSKAGIQAKIAWSSIVGVLRGTITDVISEIKPDLTDKYLVELIGRLKWVREAKEVK